MHHVLRIEIEVVLEERVGDRSLCIVAQLADPGRYVQAVKVS